MLQAHGSVPYPLCSSWKADEAVALRVVVQPRLFAWARERAGIGVDDLSRRFPKLDRWERGEESPTLKQLESFAHATSAPLGYFFLDEPPEERVPLPDLRTMRDGPLGHPSPDLLDTIFQCQERQEWYRDFERVNRAAPLDFVGSLTADSPIERSAAQVREELGFGIEDRPSTWTDTLRLLAERAEGLGILVMVSGIVGANTHRKLDPREFRGFALVDEYAPLAFVNGADTKAAQIFTLAHELAHVWLGESALSDTEARDVPSDAVEGWCNRMAAELLVPMRAFRDLFDTTAQLQAELERLAKAFKVSTLVVLRRARDAGYLSSDEYPAAYRRELDRVLALLGERGGAGGNFYNTQPVRVSKRFARAVITSTLEGQTLYRDALQMLGFKKMATFKELAERLGVA